MSDHPPDPNQEFQPHSLPWDFAGTVPDGDHPYVTQHLTESAVAKLTVALREIVDMTETHEGMAPRTATRVWELLMAVSSQLVAWTRTWQE